MSSDKIGYRGPRSRLNTLSRIVVYMYIIDIIDDDDDDDDDVPIIKRNHNL